VQRIAFVFARTAECPPLILWYAVLLVELVVFADLVRFEFPAAIVAVREGFASVGWFVG